MSDKSISGVNVDFKTSYTYKAVINGSSTRQVESIDNNCELISYTYDTKGNIETITTNAGRIKYSYNELDELIREDNQLLDSTIIFDYDLNGNLLSRKYYAYSEGDLSSLSTPAKTDTYQYGDANWKDKLTNFNGQSIAYDAIGNPTSYNGYSFTWDRVDQLRTITGNGKTISFKYNVEGVRTEKTVNGVTTKYHLDGDVVKFESNGTDEIYYTYDSNNQLLSMNLNDQEYFYIQNEQGDIIGLLNSTGNKAVSYQYDVWGKLLSITGTAKDTVGKKNPYRYRGYRYDEETGYYYLQSRYYNPEWGRFLNADSVGGEPGTLLSHNVFAYGFNNPVNLVDTSGNYPARVEGGNGFTDYDVRHALKRPTSEEIAKMVGMLSPEGKLVAGERIVAKVSKSAIKGIKNLLKKSTSNLLTKYPNFITLGKNTRPKDLIDSLERQGWNKEIKPGGKKSGPATIFTDPETGTKIRIHATPGEGTPYFRVQNSGGNYLDQTGNFSSNATRKELRALTHFYFGE